MAVANANVIIPLECSNAGDIAGTIQNAYRNHAFRSSGLLTLPGGVAVANANVKNPLDVGKYLRFPYGNHAFGRVDF